ncbi:glycerate kinase [Arcobacter sp. 31_11_sub10_T18]|nr:glycerate kinase [Arcobacter sp. 31_11_sub10_T18]
MKIVIAVDSFKESLSSMQVARAIEAGFQTVYPDATYVKIPVADGGEGTVQALVDATKGKIVNVKVKNPLGKEVTSYYGILGDQKTAVIEMATACGLDLLKEDEKNPLECSTLGFGQLILNALDKGITSFILGLGGSATNDAGIGMLQALGVKFLNEEKKEIGFGAKYIQDIKHIDTSKLDSRLLDIKFKVACDVSNILCGEKGATYVFGPQKGLLTNQLEELDTHIKNFAHLCEQTFERKTQIIKGCGAAGGLGFGLITFLNASLLSGIDIVLNRVNLDQALEGADLLITGEGKMDAQTINGKVPVGVARRAKKKNLKVIAICGAVEKGYEEVYDHGIDAVFDTVQKVDTLQNVLLNANDSVKVSAQNIARILSLNISEH